MATATTLASAQGANAIVAVLTSATGIAVKDFLIVDGEYELVTDVSNSPTVGVVRGWNGTLAIAHAAGAPASFGTSLEQTTPAGAPIVSYNASGAVTVPTVNQTVYLTKGGVGAMTLAAPQVDQTNTLTFVSLTAQAHTVTNATPGFDSGGTASDVATFGGAIGDGFAVKAEAGAWNVLYLHNVTLG